MIESVQFRNLKTLRDTTLPLGRFTLIVGPNGSGKSSALWALRAAGNMGLLDFNKIATAGLPVDNATTVEVVLRWGKPYDGVMTYARWSMSGQNHWHTNFKTGLPAELVQSLSNELNNILSAIRIYSFDAPSIAAPTSLAPHMTLESNGFGLAGVLDQLRDREPERFEALNEEMGRWLPEFERILFDTPSGGVRSFLLRTREGHHKIQASELSQGTLIALAMLTLAYIPDPPPIVCLEEPDRGIHPRLLREVRDAMYRLSYPENYGEKRNPVQVIATTHSPYLLDLFKDHPEEVVIADKLGHDVRFERLSDRADLDEILGDAQLGDVWYSGILGGVPSHP
jgi:predicted ATPase